MVKPDQAVKEMERIRRIRVTWLAAAAWSLANPPPLTHTAAMPPLTASMPQLPTLPRAYHRHYHDGIDTSMVVDDCTDVFTISTVHYHV